MDEYTYINPSGIIVPDTATIKSEVETEYLEAYGSDFDTDSATIGGRLIEADTLNRIWIIRNNAYLANQINPSFSTGNFLDAVCALTGTTRDGEQRSTVQCLCTGDAGTVIPAGYRVRDDGDNLWMNALDVTIPAGGEILASFLSVEFGAIEAGAGDITTIVDSVLGWTSVTNENAATVGRPMQSDVLLREQRLRELGSYAGNTAKKCIASVSALDGVRSVAFRENPDSTTEIIDGVSMTPHSTYLCVEGGVNYDIADAYYKSRSASGFVGTTVSEIVTDETSGQSINVVFDRPDDIPITVEILIKRSTSSTISVDSVKQACVNYGNASLFIGSEVSPFEIASAVNESIDKAFVIRCRISGGDQVDLESTTIYTAINELPKISSDNIVVLFS